MGSTIEIGTANWFFWLLYTFTEGFTGNVQERRPIVVYEVELRGKSEVHAMYRHLSLLSYDAHSRRFRLNVGLVLVSFSSSKLAS